MSNNDPDFTITLAGKDVTKDVIAWEYCEKEKGNSYISVGLRNDEQKNVGIAKIGDKISITFGYEGGDMVGPITMTIKTISEAYSGSDADMNYAQYIGLDCLSDLAAGSVQTGGGNKPPPNPQPTGQTKK